MGSSNNSGINTTESFNGRKLRPLIPRPSSSTTATTSTATSSSCSTRTHGSDFFALHDHLGGLEQGKRQLTAHPVSCRWNPTPEQLRVLEDLYQRGTHTPTAEQIRHITTQLRRFGKIEGKNVFYWFQNHKARERQKRRRQTQEATNMGDCNLEIWDRKDSGSSRTGFQMEACKNWLPPTTCSILAEESASMSRRRDEWLHHDPELQHHTSQEMLASWHMSNLSTSPYFINANNISNGNPSIEAAVTTVLSKQKFIINENIDVGNDGDECRRLQTLDLFPVCSNGSILDEKSQAAGTPTAMNVAPYHFFHFL